MMYGQATVAEFRSVRFDESGILREPDPHDEKMLSVELGLDSVMMTFAYYDRRIEICLPSVESFLALPLLLGNLFSDGVSGELDSNQVAPEGCSQDLRKFQESCYSFLKHQRNFLYKGSSYVAEVLVTGKFNKEDIKWRYID